MLSSVSFSGVRFSSLSDTFVRAPDLALQKKSQNVLVNEEQNALKVLELGTGSSGVKVVFEDSVSNQLISLSLTSENFTRLQDKFQNKEDYFQREDGSIRLNGEAGNFISSWFTDMAYGLNWLGADSNKDGIIRAGELSNAYLHATQITLGDNNVSFSYIGKINASYVFDEINIERGLNHRIMDDKNLDKEISYDELYDDEDLALFADFAKNENSTDSVSANSKRKTQNLLQKVLEEGINSLSQQELVQFKTQYPSQYEKLQNFKETFTQGFKQDLLQQFFNEGLKIIDLKA